MGQKQKTYTTEFKREAVRLLESSGKSGAKFAEELGINDGSLYTWHKQLAAQGEVRLSQAKATKPQPKKNCASFALR
jgi:transposase